MTTTSDETQVRACIEAWAAALRAKDVDQVMAHYTPDMISFDLAPPLLHAAEPYRQGLVEWFATFTGGVELDIRDLHIETSGDLAWSRSLNHLGGARTDGTQTDVWTRATVCFRKTGARWLVAHEHLSVPFYMDGSLRAAVDLTPAARRPGS